jgi:hypothetical protein
MEVTMTALTWNTPGSHNHDYGVDHGVLYLLDGTAVPWNGLTGVTESTSKTSKPFYIDGRKFLEQQVLGDFTGTLKAFTYPDEFDAIMGIVELGSGLYIKDQPAQQFHLSWRSYRKNELNINLDTRPAIIVTDNGDGTWVARGAGAQFFEGDMFRIMGADVIVSEDGLSYQISSSETDQNYIVHVLFNLMAISSDISYQTITDQISPIEFQWTLSSTPGNITNQRPTAHILIDAAKVNNVFKMAAIEELLYGSFNADPSVSDAQTLITAIQTILSS